MPAVQGLSTNKSLCVPKSKTAYFISSLHVPRFARIPFSADMQCPKGPAENVCHTCISTRSFGGGGSYMFLFLKNKKRKIYLLLGFCRVFFVFF